MIDQGRIVFVDTNVLIRHLTGDPPEMARCATRFLTDTAALLLVDVVAAELVYVLESYYHRPRSAVAEALRAVIGFPAIRVLDSDLLHRAIEVYEHHRLDFPEACLVASAERSGVNAVASFDRTLDRVPTIRRVEPA